MKFSRFNQIAWVKWSKVLASKKFGGLRVSTLHGLNGHVLSAAFNSTWSSIITEVNSLKVKGVDLISHCKIRVGKKVQMVLGLMRCVFHVKDVFESKLDEASPPLKWKFPTRWIKSIIKGKPIKGSYVSAMEHDFLSQKVGGRGRGVKEKQHGSANDTTKKIVVVSSTVDELDSGNKKGTQEGNVGKTSISSTADNVHESPTTDNSASIRSGLLSYAKLATCESSRKNVNFRSLITPVGNEVDVAISLESIRAISEWHSLDSYTFDMYMQSWGWSSYARAMIELRDDGELKNTIMVVMPKLIGEGFNMCTNVYVLSYVVKNLNNPRQATRCGLMSNPNVPLIASPEEMSHAWFKDSAEFIKGLDAQDGTFLQDDQCREKSMEQHNGVDDGDGVLDSQTKDVIEEASMLPTMSSNSPQAGNTAVSEFFAEFDALKKEVLLIKRRKDDEFLMNWTKEHTHHTL
ncbi:hypothetical protein Tco_0672462 [Tanacetum coccineum]